MYDDNFHHSRNARHEVENEAFLIDSHCKNPGCDCPVVDEGTYCSDHCRGLTFRTSSNAGCDCEHSLCAGMARTHTLSSVRSV
jgi:hypothetical protein